MDEKPRFDENSPEIKAYLQEVGHTFTREGTMVAFPTCFPGMTVPMPLEESHITALDITPEGVVFGGTSGKQSHLFVSSVHGLNGIVFDLGTPDGATHCAAVCWGGARFVAFVNGPRGGRAVELPAPEMDEDLIQEWGFDRGALVDHGECVPSEPVVHAVADASRKFAVGVTAGHLFTTELNAPQIRVVGEVSAKGRIAFASRGGVVGQDGAAHLWHYDPATRALRRHAIKLPEGSWDHPMNWARDAQTGLLYTADAQGRLFSFDESAGFSGPLGRTPLGPVGPMAVTFDGRVFGFCGDEIANMFCYDPGRREVSKLGVAASVIEQRRYGYVFGDAVTGRDGEIFFGEDDNGGHLWVYFPRIRSSRA